MGNSSYDVNYRSSESTMSYSAPDGKVYRNKHTYFNSISKDTAFIQNVKREIHKDMNPLNVAFRESRDSKEHPFTIPIQLYLDVTGSMGHIPHEMIKNGLPKLMSKLIQNGVTDAALMFGAIGDHESDNFPLQIGQFESGDAELDMWLTRSYLEGNGGANAGESYLLAWYFAAFHTKTDAFEKRNKKGFVFTVGDEPCLKNLPVSSLRTLMGTTAVGQDNYTREQLLAEAQKQNHIYHIHLNHGSRYCDDAWKQMLGKNLIEINDYNDVSTVISNTILSHIELIVVNQNSTKDTSTDETSIPSSL